MADYIDYLRAYATPREDAAYTGLDPEFGRRLMVMLQAAPEHVRRPDLIASLARDNESQARAIRDVAARRGIPFTPMLLARGIPGYAAPVGGSRHQSGMAADLNLSGLPPEGRDWLRSNAGLYGLRFPVPTDPGHLEYDAGWQGTLPNRQPATVSRLPSSPPAIMDSALYGLGASRPVPETTSLPPIFSQAMRGFRDGGAVEAALRIASKQTDKNPTDAQKESGRYAKGTFSWNGLKVAIENPKGSKRSGVDKNGQRWECTMPAHYGYIKKA